jgi:hypothetical protein
LPGCPTFGTINGIKMPSFIIIINDELAKKSVFPPWMGGDTGERK